ncbi:MAG: TatD family hydrolase [Vicinamibacterales bacterium]
MIDSHCHLAGEEFSADLGSVVSRARSVGVSSALCILSANDVQEAERAKLVREAWPGIHFAAGVHPHQAGEFAGRIDDARGIVRRAVGENRACGVGEIGLDYHYDLSPRDVQRDVFRAQIEVALDLRLPVIIHTREATEDTFAILEETGARKVRGVFHCFTGDEAMARSALDLDFYVSFAGIVTFPRADAIRAAARMVPADRVLAETDSPYLAPVPHRGKRNEPAYVADVVAKLAEIRSVPVADLAAGVTRNFSALFGSLTEATQ